MKLTASQLKQIIKEELGSMHEGSGFDGKRHKLNKSEDGQRILFTKDFLKADGSKDPMSSAKNVPASFADGYHSRAVDFVEWFEDVPLGVEDEEISYMRENSEENRILVIDSDREQNAWTTDKIILGTALGKLMTTAQQLGGRYKEGSAYKKRIKSLEDALETLQGFEA